MSRLIRTCVTLLLLSGMGLSSAFSQGVDRAVISQVRGTVEIQQPGGTWQAAEVGQLVSSGTRISTGFGASAAIDIEDSVIRVRALTRLTIRELFERENVVTTDMDLEVGRVRGEVRRASDRQFDFQLRGPTATASVRGTSFEFDGQNLSVDEGIVEIVNNFGQRVVVQAGQQSSVVGNEVPSSPVAERRSAVIVSTRVDQTDPDASETQPSLEDQSDVVTEQVTRAVLRITPVLD